MTIYAFDSSGRVKKPTVQELAEADKEMPIITLNRLALADGRPYYAYLAIKPSRYQEYHTLFSSGQDILLHEYGTILADGFADEPPPEVIRDMREQFGCDPHFEETLMQEVKQQQDTFMEKKEEQRIAGIVKMLKKEASGSAG